MTFDLTYTHSNDRHDNMKIEAGDYASAHAQLESQKPDAKVTAVEVKQWFKKTE